MNANELRVGNLIQLIYETNRPTLEERIVRVDRIDEIGVEILENGERVFGASYDVLEGIPLTEEILLKCDWGNYKPNFFNSYFEIDTKGCVWYCSDFTGIVIKFIHQLQNLYFSLTGKELSIKLN